MFTLLGTKTSSLVRCNRILLRQYNILYPSFNKRPRFEVKKKDFIQTKLSQITQRLEKGEEYFEDEYKKFVQMIKDRNIKEAEVLFRNHFKDSQEREKFYNEMLFGYAHTNIEKAIELFQEMKKEKIEMNDQTYQNLAIGYIKFDLIEKAIALLKIVKEPSEFSISLLETLVLFDKIHHFDQVISMMKVKKIPLTTKHYSIIIHHYPSLTVVKKTILSKIGSKIKEDVHIFNGIIGRFAKEKNFDQVQKILQRMKDSGIKPNEDTYSIIIFECIKLDLYTLAKEYFTEALNYEIIPKARIWNYMIQKSNHYSISIQLFKEMQFYALSPTLRTFNSLLKVLVKTKQIHLAQNYFDKMKMYNILPNDSTFEILLNGYIHIGEIEKAKDLFEKMEERKLKKSIFAYYPFLYYYKNNRQSQNFKIWKIKMKEEFEEDEMKVKKVYEMLNTNQDPLEFI